MRPAQAAGRGSELGSEGVNVAYRLFAASQATPLLKFTVEAVLLVIIVPRSGTPLVSCVRRILPLPREFASHRPSGEIAMPKLLTITSCVEPGGVELHNRPPAMLAGSQTPMVMVVSAARFCMV